MTQNDQISTPYDILCDIQKSNDLRRQIEEHYVLIAKELKTRTDLLLQLHETVLLEGQKKHHLSKIAVRHGEVLQQIYEKQRMLTKQSELPNDETLTAAIERLEHDYQKKREELQLIRSRSDTDYETLVRERSNEARKKREELTKILTEIQEQSKTLTSAREGLITAQVEFMTALGGAALGMTPSELP
ncbi:hypothetical protein BLNAU_9211 [Blattamonas nauphoetae]|uniref:Uncharacterized protein n=1 Tax=Blattamonas nauphoetae TaxID=2049346 RepID=A0ABQ9XWJ5_9EUKA|nr:hypothetical protein BLNAU_9211 [Blattamonas nauphoetae]